MVIVVKELLSGGLLGGDVFNAYPDVLDRDPVRIDLVTTEGKQGNPAGAVLLDPCWLSH